MQPKVAVQMSNKSVEINIPADKEAEIIDKVVRQHGWTDKVHDEEGNEIDNPKDKETFMSEKIRDFLHASYRARVANEAADKARQDAINSADNVDISVS